MTTPLLCGCTPAPFCCSGRRGPAEKQPLACKKRWSSTRTFPTICWVAGASAIANDLTLSTVEITFMFPWMFVIVGAMLLMLRIGHNLNRKKALVLLTLYVVYLISSFLVFPPQT